MTDYTPEEFTLELKHELQVRDMPDMKLRLRFYKEDNWLKIKVYNCSSTDFTFERGYPQGANPKPKEVAEEIFQTFLEYVEW